MAISRLFASGRVFLVRTPIDGRLGMHSLWNKLGGGSLGIKYDGDINKEVWVVAVTKNRRRLRILHVDAAGMSLISRRLWGTSKFQVMFDKGDAWTLTSAQLRRLILDGTYEGSYQTATAELLLTSK